MRRASNQSANRSELPAFLIFIRPKGHRLATYVFSPRPPLTTPQSRPFHKTGPPLNACPTSPLTKNPGNEYRPRSCRRWKSFNTSVEIQENGPRKFHAVSE